MDISCHVSKHECHSHQPLQPSNVRSFHTIHRVLKPYCQSYGFSSGHVWMRELDYKESKKVECRRIDVFELWCWKRRVPWTARRSNHSILKEISPEYSTGRTDAEAETPILWPPDAKNWLIGKDLVLGKIEGREEKGRTEDEMVGWHPRIDGHEVEQAPGDGQGSLACCSPWGCKESGKTEQLNWTWAHES